MIHVAVDTSALRADPRRSSAALRALTRLARNGHVSLHVPAVVRDEFLGGYWEDSFRANLSEAKAAARGLLRQDLPEDLRRGLDDFVQISAGADEAVPAHLRQSFDDWIEHARARVWPVAPDHGQRVLEMYFAGTPPFRETRAKADLPDGFIHAVISDMAREVEEVCLVVGDKRLAEACGTLDGVTTAESFGALLELGDFPGLLEQDEEAVSSANFMALLDYLGRNLAELEGDLEAHFITALAGESVPGEYFPGEIEDALILGVGEPSLTGIGGSEHYYGAGQGVVSFTAVVECLASFPIFKSSYFALDVPGYGVEDLNDHYFEAERDLFFEVTGTLAVTVGDPRELLQPVENEHRLAELRQLSRFSIDSVEAVELRAGQEP